MAQRSQEGQDRGPVALFFHRLLPDTRWVQAGFLLVWLDLLGIRYHGIWPFVTIGILLVIGASVGSILCGWSCPFRLLQDLAVMVPTPKFELPKWTGHGRFVVLIITVLAVPYLFGEAHPLFICRICPARGIEAALPLILTQGLTAQPITWPNPAKIVIIIVFVISILFFRRPWCRVFCGLFNRGSALFLHVDMHNCTGCEACRRLCQYNIEPDNSPNSSRCVRCLECTGCPSGSIRPKAWFEKALSRP